MAAIIMVPVHLLLMARMAGQAGRCLAEHRCTGLLTLVLATRMSAREIVQGQVLTLRHAFTGPVLFLLAGDFVLFLMDSVQTQPVRSPVGGAMPWLAGTFLCDVFALGWVGLWLGLKTQQPARAALGAVLRILVVPMVCAPVLFATAMIALPSR